MKKLPLITLLVFLAGSVSANLIGHWNFNGNLNNDLSGKSPMVLQGSSSISFPTDTIGGSSAQVCSFPAFSGGYVDYIGMPNESGLSVCSNYTLVYDIKYPSLGSYACMLDFGYESADGDFFVHNNGIGVHGEYSGTFNAATWYRIALASSYDAGNDNLIWIKYIDGSVVGTQVFDSTDVARFSVYNELRLFVDNDGETAAGLVNSFAFYDTTLDSSVISSYGGASASGIPVPEPASIIFMLTALAGLIIRK